MFKKWIFRILEAALLLFVTVSAVFFLMQGIGDGPAIISGSDISDSVKNAFIIKYGLDQSVYLQLLLFWRNFFEGSFGVSLSLHLGLEVNQFIWSKFGRSVLIAVLSSLIGAFFGIVFSLISGLRPYGITDKVLQSLAALFMALPAFIVGFIFVIMAAQTGFPVVFEEINPVTWILPVFALALPLAFFTYRQMRQRLLAALDMQYAKLALAKGLAPRNVIIRHLLRESLFNVVTTFPIQIVAAIISSILVENVFSIPGLGRTFSDAITARDYNVVLAITTMMVILTTIAYISRDALYEFLNPIIRRRAKR